VIGLLSVAWEKFEPLREVLSNKQTLEAVEITTSEGGTE